LISAAKRTWNHKIPGALSKICALFLFMELFSIDRPTFDGPGPMNGFCESASLILIKNYLDTH
jgi:hypothetical protein